MKSKDKSVSLNLSGSTTTTSSLEKSKNADFDRLRDRTTSSGIISYHLNGLINVVGPMINRLNSHIDKVNIEYVLSL